MLLTIDVGNTSTGIAIFNGSTIVSKNKLLTPEEISVKFIKSLIKDEYRNSITDIIVSSVVPFVDASLKLAVRDFFQKEAYFIDHTSKIGLSIEIDNPPELGADRIADSEGALSFFKPPFIVIDSGTAVTFDIINRDYKYLGGVIFPGIELSIRSLASNTAKLKRIHFSVPDSILGTNTENSIRAGIYYNYVGGISYMIDEFKEIIGQEAKVIATGGLADYFKNTIKNIDRFEPDLIYYGLQSIHQRRCQ